MPTHLLPLFCLAVLLSACSLFDADELPPEPTSAVAPPFTPAPSSPGSTLAVEWRAEPLPAIDGPEMERPFEDYVKGAADIWWTYVASVNAEPVPIRETRRFLTRISWLDGGESVLLRYFTFFEGRAGQFIPGAERRWVDARSTEWDLLLPGVPIGMRPVKRDFFPLTMRGEDAQFFVNADGASWTLRGQGISEVYAPNWSPDGRYFVLQPFTPGLDDDERPNYIVEPHSTGAVLAGYGRTVAWSPDGGSIAILRKDEVEIYHVATKSSASLPFGNDFGPLRWANDGRYLAIGDEVIEVASKQTLAGASGRSIIDSAISPDGRWLAVTTEPIQGANRTCDSGDLRNQTYLVEIATGQTRTLFDCTRFFANIQWVDSERFLAYSHTCWSCEGASQLHLVDVTDGTSVPLNQGFSYRMDYDVSPDGSRILVSGSELRMYTSDGLLLRRIVVDDGYQVTDVEWSPDGRSFAYIVGPRDLNVL